MLLGIASCLSPQLLYNLRSMGHGDEIALVDANYPAQTDARGAGGIVRADGIGVAELLDAVLAIMPLDRSVEHAVMIATVGGDGRTYAPVHHELCGIVARRAGNFGVLAMQGAAFYARVKGAHTVVATGEPRLYANIILRKGAIGPE
jgi:L-fucose mutarotase